MLHGNTLLRSDFKRCVKAQEKFFGLPLDERAYILKVFGNTATLIRAEDDTKSQRRKLFRVFASRYGFDALLAIERFK